MHTPTRSDHRGRATSRGRAGRAALATAMGLALTGAALLPGLTASAALSPRASGPACNAKVTAGSGTVVAQYVVGVTAGATQITFDCNSSSGAAIAAEASLLAGVGTTAVMLASEADIAALGSFTASPTDKGCPAGTAGACSLATFSVPATFSANDSQATCPPSQSEYNAGIWGCVIAVASAQQQPIAEYLVTYASQTAPPSSPTVAATVSAGPAGSTITVTDAAGHTGFWWANAVQQSQAVALGGAPGLPPTDCGPTGGYGNVPSVFLGVNWVPQGGSGAVSGSAAGLAISNACYDGKTLVAPALSGTIPVPSGVVLGTAYHVYVCELNLTSLPSNDPNAATDCGPSAPGTTWVDASFSFTPTAGTPQAALTVTSLTGTVGTPLTLTTGGGSGTGAVSFVAVNGTASGCAATGNTLTATTPGICYVVATQAASGSFLAVSSIPTAVTLNGLPQLKLLTSHARLASTSTSIALRFSCSGATCQGSLDLFTTYFKTVHHGTRTMRQRVSLNLGNASYNLAAGSSATERFTLSGAARAYLKANPTHPTLSGTVAAATSQGKTLIVGHVSLTH